MPIFKLKTKIAKSKWKKIEITPEKGFIFAPLKFFLAKFSIKKQEIVNKKLKFSTEIWNCACHQPVWRKL